MVTRTINKLIATGTVVEFSKQVNISISGKPSDDLEDAIKSFFGGIASWEGLKS